MYMYLSILVLKALRDLNVICALYKLFIIIIIIIIITMYNLPHENCNNLPQGGIFTRNTCQTKTHAHKAVLISSIYTTGILHFHTLSISSCSWIFLAQGEFSKI